MHELNLGGNYIKQIDELDFSESEKEMFTIESKKQYYYLILIFSPCNCQLLYLEGLDYCLEYFKEQWLLDFKKLLFRILEKSSEDSTANIIYISTISKKVIQFVEENFKVINKVSFQTAASRQTHMIFINPYGQIPRLNIDLKIT